MQRTIAALSSVALVGVMALSGMLRPRQAPAPPPPPSQALHVSPEAVLPPVVREGYEVVPYFSWPLDDRHAPITDYFGPRADGPPCPGCLAVHMGLDLSHGVEGEPIRAVAPGLVIETGEPPAGYGYYVVLRHWHPSGEVFDTLYAHMQPGSVTVRQGDTVTSGQQLGRLGTTGNSTGPHLHFELVIGGVQVDPLPWLEARVPAS